MHHGLCQGQEGCRLLQILSKHQMWAGISGQAFSRGAQAPDPTNILAWELDQEDGHPGAFWGWESGFCQKWYTHTTVRPTFIQQEGGEGLKLKSESSVRKPAPPALFFPPSELKAIKRENHLGSFHQCILSFIMDLYLQSTEIDWLLFSAKMTEHSLKKGLFHTSMSEMP